MAVVNNCIPDHELRGNELYGPEPYDVNFVLPVPPMLSTDKLRLVPFVPRIHAASFMDGIRGQESMFTYIPLVLEYLDDFLRVVDMWRRDEGCVLFAAIDTTRPDPNHPEWEGSIAGMFGYMGTDKGKLTTEIGLVITLPAFQRTHVSSHAIGLLLKYALDLPPHGLGFRRVRWSAEPANIRSNNLAKRMGFKLEGVARCKYVVPRVEGYQRSGKESRAGDGADGLLSMDSNEWALCWDDWEERGKVIVEHNFTREA